MSLTSTTYLRCAVCGATATLEIPVKIELLPDNRAALVAEQDALEEVNAWSRSHRAPQLVQP